MTQEVVVKLLELTEKITGDLCPSIMDEVVGLLDRLGFVDKA